jgi:AcrR family transcriptional regulator
MVRVVKAPEVRRAELLSAAARLFAENGYAATTVDAVVRATGMAKGTFYYYFRTKDDLLAALVRQIAETMAVHARTAASDPTADPVEKLRRIFQLQRQVVSESRPIVDHMHLPENREIHFRSNIETVRLLAPQLAMVVEEGVASGVFQVADPLSTVQFILAGSLFLFDEEAFHWTPEKRAARLVAMVALAERALGARPDALAPLLQDVAAAG